MNIKLFLKKESVVVSLILVVAIIISISLFTFKPVAEKQQVVEELPLAEFVLAKIESLPMTVLSQGSVTAKTHIDLVAEVSGRITHMAQLKSNGGFFKKGELLLNIDDTDYRLAISRARAQVAAAQQQLVKVEIEAGQAKYDLKQIGRDPSKSTAYALRKPHLAEARANLQAAEAELEISQLQLQRTTVIAPFDGRVIKKDVDIGQYVSTGAVLADIYSTNMVEVRLPISLYQMELLGISLREENRLDAVDVVLMSEYFSRAYSWQANLSHLEGELDERNRLVYIVAEVADPYAYDMKNPQRPSLTPGMFVKARLTGPQKSAVIKLPRSSLRSGNEVWVIDENDRLHKKTVEIYTKDEDSIYIKSGLVQASRVIINAIDYPLEGMHLQALNMSASGLSSDARTNARPNTRPETVNE